MSRCWLCGEADASSCACRQLDADMEELLGAEPDSIPGRPTRGWEGEGLPYAREVHSDDDWLSERSVLRGRHGPALSAARHPSGHPGIGAPPGFGDTTRYLANLAGQYIGPGPRRPAAIQTWGRIMAELIRQRAEERERHGQAESDRYSGPRVAEIAGFPVVSMERETVDGRETVVLGFPGGRRVAMPAAEFDALLARPVEADWAFLRAEARQVLLVGGVADGQVLAVPVERNEVVVPGPSESVMFASPERMTVSAPPVVYRIVTHGRRRYGLAADWRIEEVSGQVEYTEEHLRRVAEARSFVQQDMRARLERWRGEFGARWLVPARITYEYDRRRNTVIAHAWALAAIPPVRPEVARLAQQVVRSEIAALAVNRPFRITNLGGMA